MAVGRRLQRRPVWLSTAIYHFSTWFTREVVLTPTPWAGGVPRQPGTAFADVSHQASRIPNDEAMVRHISGNDRSRAHHRVPADRHPWQHRAATANGSTFADDDAADDPVFVLLEAARGGDRPRPLIIQQAGMRSDKNTRFEPASLEDRNEVLELHPIPHHHAAVDVYSLGENAVTTDSSTLSHLRLVPHLSTIPDRRVR